MPANFRKSTLASLIAAASLLGFSVDGLAAETNIAVAANFTSAAKEIAAAFEDETGHIATLSFGSTGKLFAQIVNGAPFTVFLAADQTRPAKAVSDGVAVEGSRFTYASGKIVLYSTDADLVDADGAVLQSPDRFDRIAIANPKTAPYGAAAMEVLDALDIPDEVRGKIVRGDSISQTNQFVASGNAQLGFLALSQVIGVEDGSRWIVPAGLYTPIRQDAVLLNRGADDEAAKAFFAFLKGDKAKAIIRSFGYGVD